MNKPVLQQPIIFLSDAHLGGFSEKENKRIENELIKLVTYCGEHNITIAILGDLFDYWMEYPRYTPELGRDLLDCFEKFNRKMGPTLYITGNHDNWTKGHFSERGFFPEHEDYTFTLNGDKIMLLHGDGLSDEIHQLPRPGLHRFIRNDVFLRFYQKVLPSKAGIGMMKYFSRFTRSVSDDGKGEKLTNWAREKLESTDIDLIICGHDHLPRFRYFSFGTYINLGTFYRHRTMVFYNNGTPDLVSWSPGEGVFTKFEKST